MAKNKFSIIMRVFYINIKKVLTIATVAFSTMLPSHSQDFEYDGIIYSVIDMEARTCRAKESVKNLSKSLTIPPCVSDGNTDYTVTEIGQNSFSGSDVLEEVSLPNTITKIGNAAFMRSNNLSSINFPESLVEIGDSAFFKRADDYWHGSNFVARKVASYPRTIVRIPDRVKRIGKRAFMSEVSLGSWPMVVPANIPRSLTEIEDYSFYCNPPEDMTMPDNLSKIGKWAFHCCHATEVVIPDNVSTIGEWAFSSSSIENVVLPSKINEISRGLFSGCYALSSVSIPESVTKIGAKAFAKSGILSIKIPDGVTTIEPSTFAESSLSSISMPSSITNIGDSAFYKSKVTDISLPSQLRRINDCLFMDCSELTSVNIPSSVESIGDYAFCSSNLINGIVLPESIHSIGKWAFMGCQLEEVSLPNSVESIGGFTFGNCKRLKKVILSDNINTIEAVMFAGCANLQSIANHTTQDAIIDGNIKIPLGIDTISYQAFQNCTSIKSVEIPSSVRFIYENPFIGCDKLVTFTIDEGNRHYKIVDEAILSIGGDSLIAVPHLLKGSYSIPDEVSTIGEQAFYGVSGLNNLTMHDGVRNIEQEAFAYCKGLSNPVISNSIVSIGYAAFAEVNFTKIVLPPL